MISNPAPLARAIAQARETDAEEIIIPTELKQTAPQPNGASLPHAASSTRLAETKAAYSATGATGVGSRAIEDPRFPFELLSDIAELESWRKELNRPVYHIHKWWAQRLGSVFRAILLGAFAPRESDILQMFYQRVRFPDAVVFDPFMGSGTTIGEALKLGAQAVGRDINPVAHFAVHNALGVHRRQEVIETFRAIEQDVAASIRHFYQARLPEGGTADVLYYFWVKTVPCPECTQRVDLFSSYIFAHHAYPARHPEARAICPQCGAINTLHYDDKHTSCSGCGTSFRPKDGPARGAQATCPHCRHTFAIARTIQGYGRPPAHRLYAKMVLRSSGTKEYLAADEVDVALYNEACSLLARHKNAYPVAPIESGYNTNQVLNYCYTHWHQMFNERQLLCLSLLAERIRLIEDERMRDLFTCLFSGMLEFNNMFASFKGEGTGAVRHMFSHHILKPERTPLEANPWGTPKSSGAFSTLFESRLMRALDYCDNPFEIGVAYKNGKITSKKVYGLSCPLGREIATTAAEFQRNGGLYVSCGDSAATDLATGSVDAVVTDPPFFDNVHYSQLADFFYTWQRHIQNHARHHEAYTTRTEAEVQQSDPAIFTERLAGVWIECYRVLRPDGLLVFTYHHSRTEGWRCILESLQRAGFVVVAAHPVKGEMSVATPKAQAKEPIDLDVILVCRKREAIDSLAQAETPAIDEAIQEAGEQVTRLNRSGRRLSHNDVRVILMAQVVKRLSWSLALDGAICYLDTSSQLIETAIDQIHQRQRIRLAAHDASGCQLALW